MQILKNILMISGGNSSVTDEYGSSVSAPEIKIGIAYEIDLDLRSANASGDNSILAPYPYQELSAASGFYMVIDGDWNHSTTPKLFITSGISLYQDEDGHTHLHASLPNTAQPGILAAVAASKSISLFCEIGGYAASGSAADAIFAFDFTLTIRNRIYIGETVPETVENDPEYLNAVQVRAIIAEYLAAGIEIGTVTSGEFASASISGAVPNQQLNLVLPKGDPGTPGKNGTSTNGVDGLTPYIDPETKNWKIGSRDTEVCAEGKQGQRGQGMEFDASGSIAEKALYDDEEEGFKFAATVINSTAKTTTLYIWTKLSDASADWSDALTFVFYSSESEATILQPIEFDPPAAGAVVEYYHFSLANYPNACVCQVALDTADGELLLPYYSDLGVKKILKIGTECYIYFGSNIPAYNKGRVYLSQFVAAEASSSTNTGGGNTPGWINAAEEIYYGYIPAEDAEMLNSVADITQEMIDDAITAGTVTRVEANSLSQSVTVPQYGWLFVALPVDSTLAAKKDDGFGAQVNFAETNAITGTSATGLKFYGEFSLVEATHTVYVS